MLRLAECRLASSLLLFGQGASVRGEGRWTACLRVPQKVGNTYFESKEEEVPPSQRCFLLLQLEDQAPAGLVEVDISACQEKGRERYVVDGQDAVLGPHVGWTQLATMLSSSKHSGAEVFFLHAWLVEEQLNDDDRQQVMALLAQELGKRHSALLRAPDEARATKKLYKLEMNGLPISAADLSRCLAQATASVWRAWQDQKKKKKKKQQQEQQQAGHDEQAETGEAGGLGGGRNQAAAAPAAPDAAAEPAVAGVGEPGIGTNLDISLQLAQTESAKPAAGTLGSGKLKLKAEAGMKGGVGGSRIKAAAPAAATAAPEPAAAGVGEPGIGTELGIRLERAQLDSAKPTWTQGSSNLKFFVKLPGQGQSVAPKAAGAAQAAGPCGASRSKLGTSTAPLTSSVVTRSSSKQAAAAAAERLAGVPECLLTAGHVAAGSSGGSGSSNSVFKALEAAAAAAVARRNVRQLAPAAGGASLAGNEPSFTAERQPLYVASGSPELAAAAAAGPAAVVVQTAAGQLVALYPDGSTAAFLPTFTTIVAEWFDVSGGVGAVLPAGMLLSLRRLQLLNNPAGFIGGTMWLPALVQLHVEGLPQIIGPLPAKVCSARYAPEEYAEQLGPVACMALLQPQVAEAFVLLTGDELTDYLMLHHADMRVVGCDPLTGELEDDDPSTPVCLELLLRRNSWRQLCRSQPSVAPQQQQAAVPQPLKQRPSSCRQS